MTGCWPSSFSCVFVGRGQYPAILTEKTWSVKDLSYGKVLCFFFIETYLSLFAPKAPRLIKGAHNNTVIRH